MAINSLNSISHGLSGLASGMDTQSMVDSMLAGTQAKIDKQKANKTILNYKRDTYRDTITSLKTFQQNFFSFGGSNNMIYSSFYNKMSTTSTSTKFKVTAGSGALTGKTSINSIEKLAQTLKLKSKLDKTTAKVEGELDLSKLKKEDGGSEIQLVLDGVSKTIKLPQITMADPENPTQAELGDFVKQLNASIKHTFGNGVTAELDGTKISFKPSDKSREFQIIGSADAMGALGLKTGISNKINTRMSLESINFEKPLVGDSFKFKINGVEITADASDSLDSVISKINNSDANVKVRYSSIEDKFSIESTVSGEGSSISMSQSEGNLLTAMFGVGSGGAVTGKAQYEYDDISGKVPGVTDGMSAADITTKVDAMEKNLQNYLGNLRGHFVLNVDGEDIKIEIPSKSTADYNIENIIEDINKNTDLMDKGISLSIDQDTGKVNLAVNPGVKVTVGNGMNLMGISGTNEKLATGDSTLANMGFTGDATTGKLEIDINGEKLSFALTSKYSDVTAAMEAELKKQATDADLTAEQVGAIKVEVLKAPPGSEGKIRLFGVDIPMDITISGDNKALFGTDKISLSTGKDVDTSAADQTGNPLDVISTGQNSVMYINGERIERNSNEFTVGGMSFELKETFNEGYSAGGATDTTKYETVDVARDTDQIYNGVVKFMDEYNKIVEKTWSMLKAKTTYKDYPPLSDKQKESMSDREVELWEKKSQEGLMRSDETLTAIMDTMRRVLSQKPEGSKYSLADMGLTTGYDMETGVGGKLEFNDGAQSMPGDKLRKMIAEEPEALEKLFTDSQTGLLVELNNVVEGATIQSGNKNKKYGRLSLVDVAGSPTLIDTSSKLYNEAKAIDTNLENLNRKYKAEYSRYWKQFNAMEQMVQQMNQQSSWLTQQLGG